MIKLTPFHLDIVDVHGSDIVYALLFCMFLFCSPSPDRNCARQFFYVFKCYQTENCPRKCLAVAFGYSINCMISMSSNAVPVRGSLPRSTSFFQFESFMWSSMTFLRCNVDIPLVLLEIFQWSPKRFNHFAIYLSATFNEARRIPSKAGVLVSMDMEKTDAQSELQAVRNLEVPAAGHPILHMNAPLTHDIVANEGCLYASHVKVQGFEY